MAARETAAWQMETGETAAGGRAAGEMSAGETTAGATEWEGMPTGEMLAKMRTRTRIRILYIQLMGVKSLPLEASEKSAEEDRLFAEILNTRYAAESGNAPGGALAVAPAPAEAAAAQVDHVAEMMDLTDTLHINPVEQSEAAPRARAPTGRKQVLHRKKTLSHPTQHKLRKKGKSIDNMSLKELIRDLKSRINDDMTFKITGSSCTVTYVDEADAAVAVNAAAGTSAGTVSGASAVTLGGTPAWGGSELAVPREITEGVVPLEGGGLLELAQLAKEGTGEDARPFDGMSVDAVRSRFVQKYMGIDAYVNYQSADGHYPLQRALDNPLTMWAMIKYVPFDRAGDARGRSVLHRLALADAAGERCWGLVQFVVCGGAEVNAFDANGATPLHYTAHGGSLEMAKELFAVGASVHELAKAGPWRGLLPLHVATDSAVREFLLQYKNVYFKVFIDE